jgi:uncharacterized repeat protein (TIGR03803 family)
MDAPGGRYPSDAIVVDSSGNVFGTTTQGGPYGDGTLFEIQASSGVATTLAVFNGANGDGPHSLIADSDGDLFGTTWDGGLFNCGTVFEIPKGTNVITTLASFNGTSGREPSGISVDSNGNLFGSTYLGGPGWVPKYPDSGGGVVFEIPKASGTITTVASFDGASSGDLPLGGISEDSNGNLFGTTTANNGTVFEIKQGSGKVTTLLSYVNGGGGWPLACTLVEDPSGDWFGTTPGGGLYGGTIFEIPNGTTTVKTVINFTSDNGDPSAKLFRDSAGNLLGTTKSGLYGGGSVFEFSPGTGAITTVASFNDVQLASVIEDVSGNLFGVDPRGPQNEGTVCEIQKGGTTATDLASFHGTTGYEPLGSLVADSNGNLFGVAEFGGYYGDGAVFEVQKGSGTVTAVAAFNGANGLDPQGPLVIDSNGNLFGVTTGGGATFSNTNRGDGTVFEIKSGSGTITTLASFSGPDGSYPTSLLEDSNGNLFGTTENGGSPNPLVDYGTVFEIPSGSGAVTTIANFNGTNKRFPTRLLEDAAGNLLGVAQTDSGIDILFEVPNGSNSILDVGQPDVVSIVEDRFGNIYGYLDSGGVFKWRRGTNTIFSLPSPTNAYIAALTVDYYGDLFGVTGNGGDFGLGSVFEIRVGGQTATTLGSFNGANGSYPGGITVDSNGNLFGTTYDGGPTNDGTVFEASAPPVGLPSGSAGVGYRQTLTAPGGTGSLTFSETGQLPAGLTLSSTGVLSGMSTVAGDYSFKVTVTDGSGTRASRDYILTINPGSFSQYTVTIAGSTTVPAGQGFAVNVHAADRYGNPVSLGYYVGVGISINTTNSGVSIPSGVGVDINGQGHFLAAVQKVGTFAISVSDGVYQSQPAVFTVIPGHAVKLAFGTQPGKAPTGVTLAPVTVQLQDLYGNVVTSDNSDSVTVGVGNGPGSFTSASTLTAIMHNGVATFNNLVLTTLGTYQLSAVVAGLYTGPYSTPFSVTPLQVVPGSFAGTPSGFSLRLNAPVLVNATTPALYGTGAATPTVTLTQTSGTPPAGTTLPYQVPGSLLVDPATNTVTFVATDTASLVSNGTPLLPDGVYVVHITSSGSSGLQALNSGGGYLDGTNTGTPGNDYSATFTVGAAAAGDDVVWIPATADGPGQALTAPGMNQAGGGYPVYLDDRGGRVTDVQATLTYNPTLLTVMPGTNAGFTVTVPGPGTALVHYHGTALAAGTRTPIGFITAQVPAGTTASPTPYKASDLLVLSRVSLNGGAIAALGDSAVHLVAYVGDADGDGTYSSNDALHITRVVLQAESGFAAYPLVDPVIVADTDGSGFIPADAALQANEAGVGVPTANLAIPPVPTGVHFLAAVNQVHPSARIVQIGYPVPSRAAGAVQSIQTPLAPTTLNQLNWDAINTDLDWLGHPRRRLRS